MYGFLGERHASLPCVDRGRPLASGAARRSASGALTTRRRCRSTESRAQRRWRARRVLVRPARPTGRPRSSLLDAARAGRRCELRSAGDAAGRPGLTSSRARGDRVPDRGTADARTPSTTRRRNPDFAAPAGELPPLIVMQPRRPDRPRRPARSSPRSSSGPAAASRCSTSTTAAAPATAAPTASGSTATGAIVDVEDCVNARALPRGERARPTRDRLAIRGGSAGGYTTLCALTFHDVFKAGASYYGISDLEALARDTHKFESRYLDWLVGP